MPRAGRPDRTTWHPSLAGQNQHENGLSSRKAQGSCSGIYRCPRAHHVIDQQHRATEHPAAARPEAPPELKPTWVTKCFGLRLRGLAPPAERPGLELSSQDRSHPGGEPQGLVITSLAPRLAACGNRNDKQMLPLRDNRHRARTPSHTYPEWTQDISPRVIFERMHDSPRRPAVLPQRDGRIKRKRPPEP